jgi:hypothetical protein
MNTILIDELLTCRDNVASADHWITPFAGALQGLRAADAAWKPSPDERSIWEIVHHVAAWLDWAVRWLGGTDTDVVDWPPVTDTGDDAWRDATARCEALLNALSEKIRVIESDALFEAPTPDVTPTTRLRGIMSMIVHLAYHAGQITKIRERLQ